MYELWNDPFEHRIKFKPECQNFQLKPKKWKTFSEYFETLKRYIFPRPIQRISLWIHNYIHMVSWSMYILTKCQTLTVVTKYFASDWNDIIVMTSAGGVLTCVYASSATYDYVLVLNRDVTTDESSTYRIACLVRILSWKLHSVGACRLVWIIMLKC